MPPADPQRLAFEAHVDDYDDALVRGLALSGEGPDYFAQERVRWLATRLRETPARVLDFGCGTGRTAVHLARALGAREVVGVEVSPRLVERATERHGRPGVRFAVTEALAHEAPFDLAYTNGVFHHIPPAARPEALRQVRDALRPGGAFALWENNPWSPGARLVMARIPFDRDAVLLWPRATAALLRASGFDVERVEYRFVFPRPLRRLRWLEPHVARWPLGAQYLVLARRVG